MEQCTEELFKINLIENISDSEALDLINCKIRRLSSLKQSSELEIGLFSCAIEFLEKIRDFGMYRIKP